MQSKIFSRVPKTDTYSSLIYYIVYFYGKHHIVNWFVIFKTFISLDLGQFHTDFRRIYQKCFRTKINVSEYMIFRKNNRQKLHRMTI